MPGTTHVPTPEQQQVLDRIRAQRERLRARRQVQRQARAAMHGRVDPHDPLLMRLLTFARLHPLAVAAVAAVAALVGPKRVMRVAGVVLPAVLRMRRG
ncbi:MAG TPA: hypothetical protein PLL92_06175 [Alicycliphilus sp.]|nr:hypothetical protein [Alicycliphilus sp.]